MKTIHHISEKIKLSAWLIMLGLFSFISMSSFAEEPCCLPTDYSYTQEPCVVCFNPMGDCPDYQYTTVWNFGDGTVSYDHAPCHYFPQSGVYTVTLTSCCLDNPERCEKVEYDVTVECPCDAPCSVHPIFVAEEIAAYGWILWDYSTVAPGYSITNWYWTVNGTPFSTDQSPIFVANNPGEYEICLTVTASNGVNECASQFCWILKYEDNCCPAEPSFTYNSGAPGLMDYQFQGYEGPNAGCNVIWSWDFGDGTFGTVQNPSHTFSAPGTYNVCLTVTMQCWFTTCVKTYCQEIVVEEDPCTCPHPEDITITVTNIGNCQFNISFSGVPDCFSIYAGHWNLPDGGHDVTGYSIIYTAPGNGNYNGSLDLVLINNVTHQLCDVGLMTFQWYAQCGSAGATDPNDGQIEEFKVTPNPNDGDMNISFMSSSDSQATLQIRNITGDLIHEEKITCVKGFNFMDMNKSNLMQAGTYSIILIHGNQHQNIRSIVIK